MTALLEKSRLMQVYEESVRNNVNYCKMCLRNVKKRKLVPPVHLTKLFDELSILDQIQLIQVCYVCEARAKTALQFMTNVTFAVSVDKVFQNMKKNPSFRRDYVAHYSGKFNNKKASALIKLASECDEKLPKIQSQSQLQSTEVLVVHNQLGDGQANNNQSHQVPAEEPSFDNVVILDDDEEDEITFTEPLIPQTKQTQVVNSNPNQVVPTNAPVISGPPPAIHKLVSLAKLVENTDPTGLEAALINDTMQLLSRDLIDRNKFIIHPILHGIDGHLYIPSLPAKLVNGGLEHLPNNEPIRVLSQTQQLDMKAIEKAIVDAMAKNSLKQKAKNKEVLLSLDDLQRKIKENEKQEEAKRKRSISENTSDKRCKTDASSVFIEIDNSPGETQETSVKAENPDPLTTPTPVSIVKNPISKSGKIDWEDKIPMDIISFVDEQEQQDGSSNHLVVSDNNAAILIQPQPKIISEPVESEAIEAPMGFITQIRSLSPTEMIGIDEEDKISCIDLC